MARCFTGNVKRHVRINYRQPEFNCYENRWIGWYSTGWGCKHMEIKLTREAREIRELIRMNAILTQLGLWAMAAWPGNGRVHSSPHRPPSFQGLLQSDLNIVSVEFLFF